MSRMTLTGSSLVTIGAVAVTVIAVAGAIPPLLDAALSSPPADTDLVARFDQFAERHEEIAAANRSRFDGRSFFFAPKPPADWSPPRRETTPPPVRPRVEEEDDSPPPPPPPPPPVRYTGPDVVGVDGQSVYFDKEGIRIGVGETDEDLGVTVLSVEGAPWTVKISYRDTEFDLPLFKDWGTTEKFFTGAKSIEGSGSAGGVTPVIQPAAPRNRAQPVNRGERDDSGRGRRNDDR